MIEIEGMTDIGETNSINNYDLNLGKFRKYNKFTINNKDSKVY